MIRLGTVIIIVPDIFIEQLTPPMNTSSEKGASDGAFGGTPTEDDASTPREPQRGTSKGDASSSQDDKVDSACQAAEGALDHKDVTFKDSITKSKDLNNMPKPKPNETVASSKSNVADHSPTSPPSYSKDSRTKRLSSSVENVDLEYSLGSLESPHPSKRQCFSLDQQPSSAPSSAGSAKKKKLTPMHPIKSVKDALKPKFWQDSASVSENNIASASFDVAEEDGGSSPLSVNGSDNGSGAPSADVGEEARREQRRLSDMEERNIAEAEDVMRVAALAAEAETTPRGLAGSTSSENLPRNDSPSNKGKETEKDHEDDDVVHDFDEHVKAGRRDTVNDELDSNADSSASSLVESYMAEEEFSRPLPPAPPSTPAAPNKDAFTPLPYQSGVAQGELLSYGDELRRDELNNCSDQGGFDPDASTPPQDDIDNMVPPPPFDPEADTPLPVGESTGSSSRKYNPAPTPDLSGAVTEPRRGGGNAGNKAGGQLRPRLSTKSDFDKWDVGDRYQLKRMLGRGSYGEVAQAIDLNAVASPQKAEEDEVQNNARQQSSSSSTYVAVKKISKAFDQEVDAIRLYREMHILRRLRGHACVIQLVDVVQPRSSDLKHFNDLYLVFEYVDTDLYKLIMSPQYLTTEHIQTFLYQMLVGLKYIHSSSVIHRDLKPAILLNEDCTLKICDFGLARIVHDNKISPTTTSHLHTDPKAPSHHATVQDVTDEASHLTGIPRHNLSRQLTKHVVTRWYRAPELILIQPYASAVDIWSIGCIFGELLSMQEGSVPTYQDRVPLFPGGSCYPLSGDHVSTTTDERLDQLSVIFSVIGMPSEEDLKSVGKANEYIRSLEKKPGRSLESLYPAADPAAINLLKSMLMFNPAKRCTAEEALDHEFLKPVRRKDMEICATEPLGSPEFLERSKIDIETLKEETYKEVLWYKHPR